MFGDPGCFGACLVSHNTPTPHVFCKSIFLKRVKVVCFDRLLQVLILRDLGTRRGRGLRGLGTGSGEEQETKMAQSSWLEGCDPPVAMKRVPKRLINKGL